MILSASTPQYHNSELDQFFADNENKTIWNLVSKKLTDQDMVIVARKIKQNIKVREVQAWNVERVSILPFT